MGRFSEGNAVSRKLVPYASIGLLIAALVVRHAFAAPQSKLMAIEKLKVSL